jgi:GNAT superfamily N-acetyltransferase
VAAAARPPRLRIAPATAANWRDLCALFGSNGACGGCWCQTMRLSAADFAAGKGDGNRRRLRRQVAATPAPGLLGYFGDEAVAWLALGPRREFARLATSRVLAPVDDRPVWSVACLFIAKAHRRRGLSTQLLRAAVAFAAQHGAATLEGYPHANAAGRMPDLFAWTGFASAFARAGFVEVARRSRRRPIVRSELGKTRRAKLHVAR